MPLPERYRSGPSRSTARSGCSGPASELAAVRPGTSRPADRAGTLLHGRIIGGFHEDRIDPIHQLAVFSEASRTAFHSGSSRNAAQLLSAASWLGKARM